MGRPKKLNLYEGREATSKSCISLRIKVHTDGEIFTWQDYNLYCDTCLLDLPCISALVKQIKSILNPSIVDFYISSIKNAY